MSSLGLLMVQLIVVRRPLGREDDGEFEAHQPLGRVIGADGKPSAFEREADRRFADFEDPACLEPEGNSRGAATFPIEGPVEVAIAGKPAVGEVVGEGGGDEQAVDAGPIGGTGKGDRILGYEVGR